MANLFRHVKGSKDPVGGLTDALAGVEADLARTRRERDALLAENIRIGDRLKDADAHSAGRIDPSDLDALTSAVNGLTYAQLDQVFASNSLRFTLGKILSAREGGGPLPDGKQRFDKDGRPL